MGSGGSWVLMGLLIAALLPAIQTITVSPDLGVRNTTTKSPTEKFIPLIYNKTTDDTINIPDRYRRLIPYMTFYIPNQFPISQHYNLLPNHQQHVQQQPLTPSRQKQIIAVYQPQSHQQPPSEPENQPHQQQQHQQHQQLQQVQNLRSPIYVPAKYSNQRPHYQTIIYNTRHQTATNKPSHGNQHIYPLQPQTDRVQVPVPVPFKESHVIKVPVHAVAHQHHHHLHQPLQPQLTNKFNLTPFSPGNKIPGHFTPIVYPEDENGIPFSPKVSPEQDSVNDDNREQYGEISLDIPSESGVHKYPPQPVNQQIQVLQLQPQPSPGNSRQPQRVSLLQPIQIHPSPSPTPRPVFTIVTEFPITHQQDNIYRHQLQDEPSRHQLQDETPRHQMTNEEKYVAYLQEKIKQRELQRNSQLQQQSQNQQNLQQQQHQHQHQQQHQYQQLAPATNHEQQRLLQPIPQNYLSVVKTTRIPDNHPEPPPHIVYPIKTDLPREYEHLSETEDAPPEQSLTSNTNESDGAYINYPHPDQLPKQSPSPRPKQYYKPKLVYFTTPPPVIITPSVPIYEESFPPQVTKTPMRNPAYQDSFYGERTAPKLVPSSPSTSRPQVQITSSRAPSIAASYRPQHASQKPQFYDNPESVRQNHSPIYDTTAIKLKNSYKPVIQTKPTPFAAPRRKLTKSPPPSPPTPSQNERPFPDLATSSLAEILHKLQESNHLPKTLTPDNIDNSIKTLVKILNNLKESQTIVDNPPQHHEEDYDEYKDTPNSGENYDHNHKPGPNTGRPGIDYPALAEIPHTRFNCKEQRYKGFFGDPETNCQVWHYCDLNGGQASFLCPNGTIFSQVALTCDWWFNVKCSSTAQLYVLNERLYKYILPFTPKFPEDYSGPLVDKYLALKFQEMEEKMRKQKLKGKHTSEDGNAESEESNSGEIDESSDTEEENTSSEEDDEVKGTIDTGLPYPGPATNATSTESSLSKQPVVVSTTVSPASTTRSPGQPETKTITSVESEKVEVIEIKSDGSSGHLIPNPDHGYSSRK